MAVVHSSDLEDNSKIASRLYRNSDRGYLVAQDLCGFVFKAEAIVHLSLHPRLEIDYEVDLLSELDSAHTEEPAHVNYTDSAKLNIVADDLGCASYKSFCGNSLDLYCVVCDKSMTALYKLDRGFGFTYTGVAKNENTFAVDLNKNAMSCDTGRELNVE